LTSVAAAQDSAHVSATARSLFQEGIACSDHQDWVCATEHFGAAYRLRPSPVIASNYAIALMHLERWLEASEAFRAVQRDASATAELRADAAHYIAEIEPRLGRVSVEATGSLEGVTITMDGHDVTPLVGVVAPCDPGEHLVEAHRGGEVVASASVHVDSSARGSVALVVPAPPVVEAPSVAPVVIAEPTPPTPAFDDAVVPPAHHAEVYEEWWFWTLIGVGIAAVAVGVTVGVLESQGSVLPMGTLGTIDGRP
jgi:hypothetical protein